MESFLVFQCLERILETRSVEVMCGLFIRPCVREREREKEKERCPERSLHVFRKQSALGSSGKIRSDFRSQNLQNVRLLTRRTGVCLPFRLMSQTLTTHIKLPSWVG